MTLELWIVMTPALVIRPMPPAPLGRPAAVWMAGLSGGYGGWS